MASNLYQLIAREKWQLSAQAGYDIGTPTTVSYLFHIAQDARSGRATSPFHKETVDALGYEKSPDRVVWRYLFENELPDSDADTHVRGEMLRYGARHLQRPLHDVEISAELVRDYVVENSLPNGIGKRLAKEFGVNYLLEQQA
ncbi:MAG: hypothetical protein Q8Q31_03980 [Nanoarchaeota archaeon]|nr:hypothetical protein [Nanoarchaeota archaeon]